MANKQSEGGPVDRSHQEELNQTSSVGGFLMNGTLAKAGHGDYLSRVGDSQ